jgi:4-amino-4-deoxy-L-arabinose transferase-like glycosyltransferase
MQAKATWEIATTETERLFIGAIFLTALTLRVLASDVPFTIDETLWMLRGRSFLTNLYNYDLAGTYLRHHPGVTNMWVSSGSLVCFCTLQKLLGVLGFNSPTSLKACYFAYPFPSQFYSAVRLTQALITSSCMVFFYLLTRRLISRPVAMIAVSLLVLEPFFLAYQRLVTTDALQSDFSALTVLSLLLYLRSDGDNRRLLVLSGLSMGLAMASKIPSLFVLPAIIGWVTLIELKVWRDHFPKRGWTRQVTDLGLWGGIALSVFFLLWPALWVAPAQTIKALFTGVVRESEGSHQFFLGQLTFSPGFLFYPVVLGYRLSPILQGGVVITFMFLLVPRWRRFLERSPELTALALVALSILLILSASKTKIDRYILPTLPELAVLAAVGWWQVYGWSTRWEEIWRKSKNIGRLVGAAAFTQCVFLFPHYPYYLTYYNPLLGGAQVAQQFLLIGSGEGLDQVAQWLNRAPDVKELIVASWHSGVLATPFRGQTLDINKNFLVDNRRWWAKAHRVVLYIDQVQCHLPEPATIAYFMAQKPLYTLRLHGVDYAYVFPGPIPSRADLDHMQFPLALSFADRLQLIGYEFTPARGKTGDALVVSLYWKILSSLPDDTIISIGVRDQKGMSWGAVEAPLLAGFLPPKSMVSGMVVRDVHRVKLNRTLSTGPYSLEVGCPSCNQASPQKTNQVARKPHTLPVIIRTSDITGDTAASPIPFFSEAFHVPPKMNR